MPRLILFAPCERLIVGGEDNTLTMVAIMSEIYANVPFPLDQPLPENASIPMRWYFGSLWMVGAEEHGKPFVQRIELKSEDGKVLLSSMMPFTMDKVFMRCIIHIQGFPISKPGMLKASLAVRAESAVEWSEVADFPMLLSLQRVDQDRGGWGDRTPTP